MPHEDEHSTAVNWVRLLPLILILGLTLVGLWLAGPLAAPARASALDDLLPAPGPGTQLRGSQKVAWQRVVGPGGVVTYTIHLRSMGNENMVADVIDPLPSEMTYIPDSADPAASYDPGSATLTWQDVVIPARGEMQLTFGATAAGVAVPTTVTNTATIRANGESFERSALVWLMPEPPCPGPDLLASQKLPTRLTVASGDIFTYTIWLRNRGPEEAVAQVTDPLPPELTYVEGSASPLAGYDPDSRTLSWSGVTVPASEEVPLAFAVAAAEVTTPTAVNNTAIISTSGGYFERWALVWLMPEPTPPQPNLLASQKHPSRRTVASGEVFTYTIGLRNRGPVEAAAQVTDPLPPELTYVEGSASPPAAYEPGSRTLSWSGVVVPARAEVPLTFAVTAAEVSTPSIVINSAVISTSNESLERWALVWLVPEHPQPPQPWLDLMASHKRVSQRIAQPGDILTYTVSLRNWAGEEVVVDVADPLPGEVFYVADSADPGADYDAGTAVLSWDGITVPARGETLLAFAVTVGEALTPTMVTNTAVISAGGESLERSAIFLLVPERPAPQPRLRGSHKVASPRVAESGEPVEFVIQLHNSGTAPATALVTDPLPQELTYWPGSAIPDADYDEQTRTLTWSNVIVPVRSGVRLQFSATAAEVMSPTMVTNTATVSAGDDSVERKTRVLLVPARPPLDVIPPVVHSLTIDGQDVLDNPTTTLHISATDNVEVRWMHLKEWTWTTSPVPHWRARHSTGWIPYQAEMPWTLDPQDGVHFVGVWVADAAHNVSYMSREALDYASLVRPEAVAPPFGVVPYMVYYDAGIEVTAEVSATSGDANLYVWYTGALATPIATATKEVAFTTENAGAYLFVIDSEPGTIYELSIDPAGGPRPPVAPLAGATHTAHSLAATAAAGSTLPGTADDLLMLFTQSGLDPLESADATDLVFVVYLPLVAR